jgi:hypothetical protein
LCIWRAVNAGIFLFPLSVHGGDMIVAMDGVWVEVKMGGGWDALLEKALTGLW